MNDIHRSLLYIITPRINISKSKYRSLLYQSSPEAYTRNSFILIQRIVRADYYSKWYVNFEVSLLLYETGIKSTFWAYRVTLYMNRWDTVGFNSIRWWLRNKRCFIVAKIRSVSLYQNESLHFPNGVRVFSLSCCCYALHLFSCSFEHHLDG